MPTHNIEKTFGLVIAFLFPGLIGLYALSLHIDDLSTWLGTTSGTGPGAAGFFLVLLLAAGFGVIISGARSELIDKRWRSNGRPAITWSTRRAEAEEVAYQNLVIQFYRYAQFHGNVVVAATGLFVSWLLTRLGSFDLDLVGATVAWSVASRICWRAGRDMLLRYDERRKELLNGDDGQTTSTGRREPGPQAPSPGHPAPTLPPQAPPRPSDGQSLAVVPAAS